MLLKQTRPAGIAALIVATSGWGSMFLVSKSALHEVDPFWFTLIRYTVAALLFAALLAPRGAAPWQKLRASAAGLGLRGLLGFGFFSVMLLEGLARSVPSHGAVIIATAPITTQLLRWALDGVRPARRTLATMGLALAGVVVVSGVLGHGGGAATWQGDAIALLGTLGWIGYTRGAARYAALDPLEYSALTVIASWPVLLAGTAAASALGFAQVPQASHLHAAWPALLYVGVVSSSVSVLAFNVGVRALGPITATAFLNVVPVSALLLSVLIGKPVTTAELVGTAMVVAALLIHTRASRPAADPAPARPQRNGYGAVPGSAAARRAPSSCGAAS